MARQNTFTIIPQGPRFDGITTPTTPMTSKQARKAYKAASKTPSMTRAERHRWERDEQERIRKEFEKDKAAAKARLARDKKKEKEMQQRDEKRRNGLPLVSVRPSQDTIARFVRGNGNKKRDAGGALVTAARQLVPEERAEADEADETPEPGATFLASILEVEENGDEVDTTDVTRDELPLPNIDDNPSKHNTDAEDDRTIQNKTHDKQTEKAIGILPPDCDIDLSFEEPVDDNPPEHNRDANDDQMTIQNPTDHNETKKDICLLSQDYDVDISFEEPIDDNPSEHNTTAKQGQTTMRNRTDDKETEKAIGIFSPDYDVDISFEEPIDEAAFDAALDTVPAAEAETLPDGKPLGDVMKSSDKAPTEEAVDFLPSQDLLDEEINTDMMEELEELMSGGKTPAKPQPVRKSPSPRQTTTNTNTTPRKERENVIQHKPPTPQQWRKGSPLRRRLQSLTSPERPRQAPPTGTQAILVNFDDFFPSSSQQLRELDEEQEASQQEDMPKSPTHGIQQDTMPQANTPPQGSKRPSIIKSDLDIGEFESEFGSFPSTAHFSLLECSIAAQPPRPTPRIHKPPAGTSGQVQVCETKPPPPQQPPRFFTSSGSREQLSLAMQRSRRSAALEQIQEKERRRQEAGLVLQQQQSEAGRRPPAGSPVRPRDAAASGSKAAAAEIEADKENVRPEMRGSQETEYGGDWVEDEAWDLPLC